MNRNKILILGLFLVLICAVLISFFDITVDTGVIQTTPYMPPQDIGLIFILVMGVILVITLAIDRDNDKTMHKEEKMTEASQKD